MLLADFFNSKYFFEIKLVKEATIGSLWEAQTKTSEIDYFTKNLSSPRFFEINNSNF